MKLAQDKTAIVIFASAMVVTFGAICTQKGSFAPIDYGDRRGKATSTCDSEANFSPEREEFRLHLPNLEKCGYRRLFSS